MEREELIQNTIVFVKEQLQGAEGGHDWFHVERVWKLAKHIAQEEQVDALVVELGALLHDIADAKFHGGDENIGRERAKAFLSKQEVPKDIREHVDQIMAHVSFKGGNFEQTFRSPELDVVQDADRLDAMGAIGIARTFNYGGFKNREIYNPAIKPDLHLSREAYKNSTAPTLNHFYEKLLLLKDRMHTGFGRKLAEQRHQFMLDYLSQFYAEWEGSL